jgi:hypothetical protein
VYRLKLRKKSRENVMTQSILSIRLNFYLAYLEKASSSRPPT